ALTEELRTYPGRTKEQHKTYLDEISSNPDHRRITMRPDVVHEVNPASTLIFDAKYKTASRSGQYPNADHYQVLAYATALGQRNAWLLYAGSGPTVSRRIRNTSVVTHELPVDVSATPQQVLHTIAGIAERAYELAGVDDIIR
uniref:McrC family protein n=1 Tax=Mesomycoplasma ovipneumoniae TaxID=29562 RepID=UPI001C52A28E